MYLRRPEAVSSSLSLAVFPAVWSLSLSIKRSPVVSKEEKKTTCEKKMTALVALSPYATTGVPGCHNYPVCKLTASVLLLLL